MSYKIKQLFLKNFKCISNEGISIDFSNHKNLTIFNGENGFGKTTIFDAIEIIFSKQITRIQKTITTNRNIKDNLFLNEIKNHGYVVLELNNSSNSIYIASKIINDKKKNRTFEENIKLFYKKTNLSNPLNIRNEILNNLQSWNPIEYITEITELKDLNHDFFNIFFYVSQENATHYLKRNEKERIESIDSLLNLEHLITEKNLFNNLMNKSKKNNIKTIKKTIIENIKEKIKEKNQNIQESGNFEVDPKFNKIFPDIKFDWDEKEISIDSKESLFKYKKKVDDIFLFLKYYDDYKLYQKNENINGFKDRIELHNYLANLVINKDIIYEKNEINFEIIENKKRLFEFNELKSEIISKKPENINLKKLSNALNYFDIEDIKIDLINEKIDDINNILKSQNDSQKLLYDFNNSRNDLKNYFIKIKDISNVKSNTCPLCGFEYENNQLLLRNIDTYTKKINNLNNDLSNIIEIKRNKLTKLMSTILEKIDKIINSKKIIEATYYKTIDKVISDNNIKKHIKELLKIFKDNNFDYERFFELSKKQINNDKILKIELENFIKEYSNIDTKSVFNNYLSKFAKFDELLNINNKETKINELKQNKEIFEKKKNYLNYLYKEYLKMELIKSDKDLEKDTVKLIKFEKIIEKIKRIKESYDLIDTFKREIIPEIEIPLYIYTGKILQNYQRGQGIFIHNDTKGKLNFVPDLNTDHDIINSFSSGQLSAFVIAFMLVMNKLYSKNSKALDIILIDDPVQTMDDINISSLIEILKNEFQNKQILLSTHEDDKAYYILYKFMKYGIDSEAKNVKKLFFNHN